MNQIQDLENALRPSGDLIERLINLNSELVILVEKHEKEIKELVSDVKALEEELEHV